MKANVLFLIVWLGLLLFVAVGCMVRETAVTPTGTAVLIVESVDTPAPSLTTQPTAKSQPTAVPTSTPMPTATNTPTPLPTSTETPIPTSTVSIVTTSVSPNGEWIAALESYRDHDDLTAILKVMKRDGSVEWVADTVTGYFVGLGSPYPFSWSQDEQFFYFTHSIFRDDCSEPGGNGRDVYRLNLINGIVKEIASGGYWYAMSPDETRLAYLSHERGLVIHNMESGEEVETKFDVGQLDTYIFMDDLVWSPNNNALLVMANINLCDAISRSSLVLIEPITFEQVILIHENNDISKIKEWTEPDKALLELFDRRTVWVNTLTGELTPAEE